MKLGRLIWGMALVSAAAGLGLAASGGGALAQSCEEAWYQRNLIYKNAGYCFKTRRAIRTFGNGGCVYDDEADVPLSHQQRRVIADLRRFERRNGCPI